MAGRTRVVPALWSRRRHTTCGPASFEEAQRPCSPRHRHTTRGLQVRCRAAMASIIGIRRLAHEVTRSGPRRSRGTTLTSTTEPTEHHVRVGDTTRHLVSVAAGPLAVCLHGFPTRPTRGTHCRRWPTPVPGRRPVAAGYAPSGLDPNDHYQIGAGGRRGRDARGAEGDADAVLIGRLGRTHRDRCGGDRTGIDGVVWSCRCRRRRRWRRGFTYPQPGALVRSSSRTRRAEIAAAMNDPEFSSTTQRTDRARRPSTSRAGRRIAKDPANRTPSSTTGHPQPRGAHHRGPPGRGAMTTAPTQPHLYLHGSPDGRIGVEVGWLANCCRPCPAALEVIEGAGTSCSSSSPSGPTAPSSSSRLRWTPDRRRTSLSPTSPRFVLHQRGDHRQCGTKHLGFVDERWSGVRSDDPHRREVRPVATGVPGQQGPCLRPRRAPMKKSGASSPFVPLFRRYSTNTFAGQERRRPRDGSRR